MGEKYIFYNGLKFTRDDKTGYYLNSTNRKRLHRYVWECNYGKIPNGYQIHHKDFDKSNNNIENLQLLRAYDHRALHGKINGEANVKSGLIDEIRPLTKAWHSSEKGHSWHKKHFEKMKDKMFVEKEFVCENCGKKFTAIDKGINKFCSNACKSSYRRKIGADNIEVECVICGKKYTKNKYSKGKTCSGKCREEYKKQSKIS